MKQRALMVLCVLLGAALVMMCDSDAVQDMVDGEEAQAAGASFTLFECPEGARLVEAVEGDYIEGDYIATCIQLQPPTFLRHGPQLQGRHSAACHWEGVEVWFANYENAGEWAAAANSGYECSANACPEGVRCR